MWTYRSTSSAKDMVFINRDWPTSCRRERGHVTGSLSIFSKPERAFRIDGDTIRETDGSWHAIQCYMQCFGVHEADLIAQVKRKPEITIFVEYQIKGRSIRPKFPLAPGECYRVEFANRIRRRLAKPDVSCVINCNEGRTRIASRLSVLAKQGPIG